MDTNYVDSDDNDHNWMIVTSTSHLKRLNSPGLSPDPKISNHTKSSEITFLSPNRYSSLHMDLLM